MWQRVEGQILLGDEEFKERFLNYLKSHEDVKEIPRSQRLIVLSPRLFDPNSTRLFDPTVIRKGCPAPLGDRARIGQRRFI